MNDIEREKAYLEQIHSYMKRVDWLAKKLVELGQCVYINKPPHIKCGEETSCLFCWIAASGKATNIAK